MKLLSNFIKLSLFLSLSLIISTSISAQTLIKNVTLFDGVNISKKQTVLIDEGKIQIIENKIKDFEGKEIDGKGKFLMPGLINCHVHLWFPNSLKEAAQAGVLAVLDMHASSMAKLMMANFRDSTSHAMYYSALAGATVPGGHGTQFGMPTPTIDAKTSAKAFTEARVAEGADYIKILREPSMPVISLEQIDTVIQTAHGLDKLVVSHISACEDAVSLSKMNIDGFVHIWWDRQIQDSEVKAMTDANVFLAPTLLVTKRMAKYLKETPSDKISIMEMEKINADLLKIHQAGVPILAGTDPPNAGINYGSDLHEEIFLMVEAGLSPLAALQTATGNAGKHFQLADYGTLKSGGPANVILINGDPSVNIKDLSNIEQVWHRGEVLK